MDDLVAFLRAQLDEDDRAARAAVADNAGGPDWINHRGYHPEYQPGLGTPSGIRVLSGTSGALDHVARHDPARVLREVEAKRRIVEAFTAAAEWSGHPSCPDEQRDLYRRAAGAHLDSCRHLAAVWAEHPGYRPEWAPTD